MPGPSPPWNRGVKGNLPSPGSPDLVWKLTSAEGDPSRRAGHGLELLLGIHLPGIFAARTRMVGDGVLTVRQWGDIKVSILEAERLLPMPEVPKPVEILHMAFVIVAFSAAGILTRDLNRHNWGRRQFSSNSSLAEMVYETECTVTSDNLSSKGWEGLRT